jgi:hypothetical protein
MDFSKYEKEIEEAVRRMLRRDMWGYFMKHSIIVSMELDDFIKIRPLPERVEKSIRDALRSCVITCYYDPKKSFAGCWYERAKSGLADEEMALVEEFWKYHTVNAFNYAQALRNYVLERFKEWCKHLEPLIPLL